MASKYIPLFLDSDGDRAQTSFEGAAITAANHDATITKMQAIETALQNICLSKIVASSRVANFDQNEDPYVPPTDHMAQNNVQARLTFKDTVTQALFTKRIYGVDLDSFTAQDDQGNWRLDLLAGEGAALKTAMDAYVLHPDTGNAAALISVVQIED